MPSSDHNKTQPVANPQTPSEARGAANLEQEIAALAVRMAAVGQARQSHKDARGTSPAEVPAGTDEPWDAEHAEALTRVYEMAEAELEAARQHPRGPQPRMQARGKRTAAAGQQAQAPESDRAWLEARFAGIAALLQQSLADSNPAELFADLAQRLDQLEARLDSLRSDMSARLGGDRLQLIDEHVKELSAHFEAASRQLTRLDAIDEQLRQLSRALEEDRQGSQAQPPGLRDDAIEALIETASVRAASRLAASMSAPAVDGSTRIGALEGMMQDYVTERRRGEEVTSGILHTIEEALIRIIDRIDAMEAPALYAGADATPPGSDGMEAEAERLAEAYASGARVLGQKGAEPALDAADYAPSAPRQKEPALEISAPGAKDAAAAEETQTRQELRASALRGKLKAQAAPEVPTLAIPEPDEATAGAAALGHAQTPAKTSAKTQARAGGARSRLLMGGAMVLLFGAGYIGVDLFLAPGPSAGMPLSSAAPAAGLAQPEPQTDKLAPRANDRKSGAVPVPQPAKRRTPESAAGDVTQSQTREQATPHLTGLQVPETARAAPAAAEPTAISPEALPGIGLQDGRLTANGGATPPGTDVTLPEALGTAALRNAAAKGDVFAQFEVATRFAEGNGVPQDQKLAFAWYERAATRGLASAQFRLGGYYERGVGVDADAERAKIWYRRAAEQGHVRAMHNLAVLIVGRGKEHADYAAAVHWFQEAAMRGYIDSQFNLATLYAHGRGVAKDLTESYKWFALAARAGDSGATRRLEEIKGQLELSEQEAAEKKLAAWRPQAVESTSVSHAGR